jgi:hypothetical protein
MVAVVIEEGIPWNFTHGTGGISNIDGFLSGRIITSIDQDIVENARILKVHQGGEDPLARDLVSHDTYIREPIILRIVSDALQCFR